MGPCSSPLLLPCLVPHRLPCVWKKNAVFKVGDFLLVTPTKLVLPEVASRTTLATEECGQGLDLLSRHNICLKVFGDYVENRGLVSKYEAYSDSKYRFAVKKSIKVSYKFLLLSDSTFFKLFFHLLTVIIEALILAGHKFLCTVLTECGRLR